MTTAVRHLPNLAKLTHQMLQRRLRHPRYRAYREGIENGLADIMISDDLTLQHGVDSIGRLWWDLCKVPFMKDFMVQAGVEFHLIVAYRAGEWDFLVDRFAKALSNDGEDETFVDGTTLTNIPFYSDIAPTLRNSSWLLLLLVLANSPYEEQFLGV